MLQDVTVEQHNSDVHNEYPGKNIPVYTTGMTFVLHQVCTKRYMQ